MVGSFADKEKGQRQSDYYSNLNREQIKLLSESGFVEIADHTYDLHGFKNGRKGVCRKKGESFSAYRELLLKDLAKTESCSFRRAERLRRPSFIPTARIPRTLRKFSPRRASESL